LVAEAGVEAGQRILIVTAQDDLAFVALLAGLTGGFVPVFADPDERDSSVFETALRCEVVGAILDPGRAPPPQLEEGRVWRSGSAKKGRLVDRLLGKKKRSAGPPDLGKRLGNGPEAPPRVRAPSDEAYVMCTSGSTSRPKCVAVSHRALLAHMQTLRSHFDYGPQSRVFTTLPFHHADGLIHAALTAFLSGARLLRPFRFELGRTQDLVDAIFRGRATHVIAVPTIYSIVESLAEDFEATFSATDLVACVSAAGPLDPGLEARWLERTGRPLVNTYGLTESVVAGTFNGPLPKAHRPGSVGVPVACELSVRDDEGHELPSGQQGELWLRGENLATRYLDDEELQASTHVDGWFRTGDLAHVDEDGFCFIDGRCDNLIICGGENISPQEIESRLRDIAGVRQAVVFAEDDSHFGQVPHALLELDPGVALEPLRPLIKQRLPGNRFPRSLKVVPEIPMGPAGKVRRKAALEQYPHSGTATTSKGRDVVTVAAEVFGCPVDSLSLRDGPDSIDGWDSLGHMRLVATVEKSHGVRLSAGQIISIRTLRDLDDAVRGQTRDG
jgi:long-chain acyl-CoA synthetase